MAGVSNPQNSLQVLKSALEQHITQVCEREGIPAHYLAYGMEITRSHSQWAYHLHWRLTVPKLPHIKPWGMQFSIDDLGSRTGTEALLPLLDKALSQLEPALLLTLVAIRRELLQEMDNG